MSAAALRSLVLTTATRAQNPALRAARVSGVRTLVTGGKKEWLCIMPDKPNVLEIRKKVKGGHYEGIQPLIASGKLTAGGAIFESHPIEGQAAPFKGSVVVYTGENVEDVRRIIENDIYATSGVWDLEKTQIIPYVAAVREPLKK